MKNNKTDGTIAKITIPKLPSVIVRERVFRLMDEARKKPIAWITGPAGAGKTTLVASYIAENKINPLWYQVDFSDADVASIFFYLNQIVKKHAPRKKSGLLFTEEYANSLEHFCHKYFSSFFQKITGPAILVLDNYQDAPKQSQFDLLLSIAIDYLPEDISIVVLSRRDPGVNFTRMRANQTIAVIGWEELAFNEEESQQMGGLWQLSSEAENAFMAMQQQVQGWAAGMVLLLEYARSGIVAKEALNEVGTEAVFQYFAGEIFSRVEVDKQQFLLRTAFLPSMTVKMATEISGNTKAGKLLSQFYQENFFTDRRIQSNTIYQYHPLFKEYLNHQCEEEFSDKELKELRAKAGVILFNNSQLEDAAFLFKEAQDWDGFRQLIETSAESIIAEGRSKTLRQWLEDFPEDYISRYAWLSYYQGLTTLHQNPLMARQYLVTAYEIFKTEEQNDGWLLSWSKIVDTFVYSWNDFNELDVWLDEMDNWLDRPEIFSSKDIESRVATGVLIALTFRQPNHPEIERWGDRTEALMLKSSQANLRIMQGNQLCRYFRWSGDLSRSEAVMETLRPVAMSSQVSPMRQLMWYINEAIYALNALSPEACMKIVEEGLEFADREGIHLLDDLLYGQAVNCALATGNREQAREYLDKMAVEFNQEKRLDAAYYHYLSAWYALSKKNYKQALDHAQNGLFLTQKAGVPYLQALQELSLSQVFSYFEKAAERDQHLQEATEIAESINSEHLRYHCLLVKAFYYFVDDDEANTLPTLRAALTKGRRQGYNTVEWWRQDMMAALCTIALENDIEPVFVRGLIRRHKLVPNSAPVEIDTWPWAIRIYSLGRFTIVKDDEQLAFKGKAQHRPLELLKAIIALGGRGITEQQLCDALWPDAEADAARNSMGTTLHRLRKLLGYENVVTVQDGELSIDARYCWVDVWAVQRLLGLLDRQLEKEKNPDLDALDQTVSRIFRLYQGDFLGRTEERSWSINLRDKLNSSIQRTFLNLGAEYEKRQLFEKTLKLYGRMIELNPVSELFYQALMRVNIKMGQQTEALKVYDKCLEILNEELGIGLSDKTEALKREALE